MPRPQPPVEAVAPSGSDRASSDIDTRVDVIVRTADMALVADALVAQRTAILDRWLSVASRQPFHAERPDHSVSDHIPALFDAVVEVLRRRDLPRAESTAPLDDDAVSAAAIAHAQVRFDQGLGPVAVVTEFRILRQEIGRAMASELDADMETSDAVAGITLVHDALLATTELVTMIDTLSDASRVAMGALDADPEPVSLDHVVRDTVGTL